MSTSARTLQEVASVDDFLNVAATETVPLFEYLEFEFLMEYDVFGPRFEGANTSSQATRPLLRFLHCYYTDIYGTRPVARELRRSTVEASSSGPYSVIRSSIPNSTAQT